MIYSNLAGTTSDEFKIGAGGSGKIISRNAYDIFWNDSGSVIGGNPNVKRIPNGTDINTMTDIGQYYMPSNAESPTLINCPTKLSFIMSIEPSTGVLQNYKYIVQKITDFSGTMYIRGYNGFGSKWGGWTQTIPTPTLKELPAIESGYFNLTSDRGAVENYGGNLYIKYGKIIMVIIDVLVTTTDTTTNSIQLRGWPFTPSFDSRSQFINTDGMVNVSGGKEKSLFATMGLFGGGNNTTILHTINSEIRLTGMATSSINLSGTISYMIA